MNPVVKKIFEEVDLQQVKTVIEAFCKLMGIDINELVKKYLILLWDEFVAFLSKHLHLAIEFISSIDWSEVIATIGLSSFAIVAGGAAGGYMGAYLGSKTKNKHGGLIGGIAGGAAGGAAGGVITGGGTGLIAGIFVGGAIGGLIGHYHFDKKR